MTAPPSSRQQAWLDARIASGEFASVEDAVRQMIDDRMAEEDDDLAWALPYVAEALAEADRGDVLSLQEHEAAMDRLLATMTR